MSCLDRILPCALATSLLLPLGCDPESKSVGKPDDAGDSDGVGETSGVDACIADHPPEGDDAWHSDEAGCAQLPPGEPPVECPDARDQAVAECNDNGVSCDPDAFMTRDAALCVAARAGLAAGIGDWEAGLVFHYTYLRPVWNVNNTTAVEMRDCNRAGDTMTFDAETGELLGAGQYNYSCE